MVPDLESDAPVPDGRRMLADLMTMTTRGSFSVDQKRTRSPRRHAISEAYSANHWLTSARVHPPFVVHGLEEVPVIQGEKRLDVGRPQRIGQAVVEIEPSLVGLAPA